MRYDFQRKGWLKDADTFHTNVCGCPECVATLNGDIARFTEFGKGNVKDVETRNRYCSNRISDGPRRSCIVFGIIFNERP